MQDLMQEQLKDISPKDLDELIRLWTKRAESLGYRVRFYPSDDFDEILQEEGFDDSERQHIDGVIFMEEDDLDRGIYIREDAHRANQLGALIHETLHAEMPHWDEEKVHKATFIEIERIRGGEDQ